MHLPILIAIIYMVALRTFVTCEISRINKTLTLNNKQVALYAGSFKRYPNYKIITNTTVEIRVLNITICGWSVLTKTKNISSKYTFVENNSFVGFSFKKEVESNGFHRCILQEFLCELQQLKPFIYDTQWDYYQMYEIGSNCSTRNPCQHGLCVDLCEEVPRYKCICDENYHGVNCDRELLNLGVPFELTMEIKTTTHEEMGIFANAWPLTDPTDIRKCVIWKNGDGLEGKFLYLQDGKLRFKIGYTPGDATARGSDLDDGLWHTVGVRYEKGSYYLMVDSDKEAAIWTRSIVADHPDHISVYGYSIGRDPCSGNEARQFDGEIRNKQYRTL